MDKREIAKQNTSAVLIALARFGWLTNRMISAIVWKDAAEGDAMARRITTRLIAEKLIMQRESGAGVSIYTLAVKGAKQIATETGISAKPGKYHPIGNVTHRAACNWRLIRAIQEGFQVWTEFEIQSGIAPIKCIWGKVPDGLIKTDEGYIWVEVEHTHKNKERRAAISKFICDNLGDKELTQIADGEYLYGVEIISTNTDALRHMTSTICGDFEKGFMSEFQASRVELEAIGINSALGITGENARCNLFWDVIDYT